MSNKMSNTTKTKVEKRRPKKISDKNKDKETTRTNLPSILVDSEATNKEKNVKLVAADLYKGAKKLNKVNSGVLKKLEKAAQFFVFGEMRKTKDERLCPDHLKNTTTLQDLFKKKKLTAAKEEFLKQMMADDDSSDSEEMIKKKEPKSRGKKKEKRNGLQVKPDEKETLRREHIVLEELLKLNKDCLALARKESEKQLAFYVTMFISGGLDGRKRKNRDPALNAKTTTVEKLFTNPKLQAAKADFLEELRKSTKGEPEIEGAHRRALLYQDLVQLNEFLSHAKVVEFIALFRSVVETYYERGAPKAVLAQVEVRNGLGVALRNMDRLEDILQNGGD